MTIVTPGERRSPRRRAVAVLVGAALGAALSGIVALALWPRPAPPLPTFGTVPPFELAAQDGATVRLDDLRDQVFAASFIFTRCETICPVIVGRLGRIQDATQDLGPAFRLVSFSVDPEHDTPEVLAAYARSHRADPRRWIFLTGSYDALQRTVVDGFKQLMERGADRSPESILHGSHIVLVDGAGRIRGYYDAGEASSVERVARDARALVHRPDWQRPRGAAGPGTR
jgi:protein SCO1/2